MQSSRNERPREEPRSKGLGRCGARLKAEWESGGREAPGADTTPVGSEMLWDMNLASRSQRRLKEIIWLWWEWSEPSRSWSRVRVRTVSVHPRVSSARPSTGLGIPPPCTSPRPAGWAACHSEEPRSQGTHLLVPTTQNYQLLFPHVSMQPQKKTDLSLSSLPASPGEGFWDPRRRSGKKRPQWSCRLWC